MSSETRELIRTYEQLHEAQRVEVADFARFLLARNKGAAPRRELAERWLASARGVARAGITTDQVMASIRGES